MKKRKLLLSAILTVSVGVAPAFAEVLSDEDLEEVSAQGLQEVTDKHVGDLQGQDNNLDSVFLEGSTQAMANVFEIKNMAASAASVYRNLLDIDGDFAFFVSQANDQTATNHVNTSDADVAVAGNINKQSQMIDIGQDIDTNFDGVVDNADNITRITGSFDNNNNSVELRDDALKDAVVDILVNAAASSVNSGTNQIMIGGSFADNLTQTNTQDANNFSNTADGVSTAVATNAELSTDGMHNVYNPDQDLPQYSRATQKVKNHFNRKSGLNSGISDPTDPNSPNNPQNVNYIEDNNNNNNSVQTKDNVEQNLQGTYLANTAQSGANFSSNLAKIDGDIGPGSLISQANDQTAGNHNNKATSDAHAIAGNFNKQSQTIDNMDAHRDLQTDNATGIIRLQNNNNNSVQKKGNSEQNANILSGHNLAMTAANAGLNILQAANIKADTQIIQTNTQVATNFTNTASGGTDVFAENAELTPYAWKDSVGNDVPPPDDYSTEPKPVDGPGQLVHNVHVTVIEQNNNNNSVQIADNAQSGDFSFLDSVNASTSATNTGMNILAVGYSGDIKDIFTNPATGNIDDGVYIEQTNGQEAYNHNNNAESSGDFALAANKNKEIQWIDNCSCTDIAARNDFPGIEPQQNNNMNSVQIKDNAQNSARGIFMANLANSAANASMNFLTSGNVVGTTLVQQNTTTTQNWNNTATAPTGSAIAGNFENLTW